MMAAEDVEEIMELVYELDDEDLGDLLSEIEMHIEARKCDNK